MPGASSTLVFPSDNGTVLPPSASTVDAPVETQPEPTDDGTTGTPR
jgi:hypothetical protein